MWFQQDWLLAHWFNWLVHPHYQDSSTILPVLYQMFALEKVQQIKSLWSNPDQPPLGFVSFLISLCV